MNSTGITRKIDNLGRIVLPKELRKNLGLKEGTLIEMLVSGNAVVLKKYHSEKKLSEMIQEMEKTVDDIELDLGIETSNAIKRNIQEIQMLLKSGDCIADMALGAGRYECPVCRNEDIKPDQKFCQICGNPINRREN